MSSELTLHGYWRSSAAYRVRIALNLKGLAYRQVPVLGVNLGRLGFLADLNADQLRAAFPAVASGHYAVADHLMYECVVEYDGTSQTFLGLNEVVFRTGPPFHMVELDVAVEGDHVSRFSGDGLIVSTPIGSTAHSLSAGGPILHPESRELIVTPVAPHLAPANSVVLPGGSLVEVEIAEGQSAILSVDGQPDMDLAGGDVVRVRTSEHAARFLRLGPPGDFYLRVGRRLNWLTE